MDLVESNNPVLHTGIEVFKGDPHTLRHTASQMWAIMRDARGVGIAAPQVGLALRLFVMQLNRGAFRDAYACINPELHETHGDPVIADEGCITWPRKFTPLKRSHEVLVSWTDLYGKRQKRLIYGMLARCFQHELDHLNGVTIF